MDLPFILVALITAAAPPPVSAGSRQASLSVGATVVRHAALTSSRLAGDATAILVDGGPYDAQIENGVLDRSADGRLTLRPDGNRPAVLTITF